MKAFTILFALLTIALSETHVYSVEPNNSGNAWVVSGPRLDGAVANPDIQVSGGDTIEFRVSTTRSHPFSVHHFGLSGTVGRVSYQAPQVVSTSGNDITEGVLVVTIPANSAGLVLEYICETHLFFGTISVPTSLCGNGVIELDEECDDLFGCLGASVPCDRCVNCNVIAPGGNCGDGVLNSGEVCDDLLGCPASQPTCSRCVNCQMVTAVCGNGIVEAPEECDSLSGCTGLPNCLSCTVNCVIVRPTSTTFCGNGIRELPEECDGSCSGITNCASCSSTCQIVRPLPASCGDGIVQPPEQCDTVCPSGVAGCIRCTQCQIITGVCGDGIIQAGEQCDGGCPDNVPQCTACTTDCRIVNQGSCGDGVIQPPEQCDGSCAHTNDPNCIACSGGCIIINARLPSCGDNIREGSEECDGGCAVHTTPFCHTCTPSCLALYCGDGIVNGNEQCDGICATADNEDCVCDAACNFRVEETPAPQPTGLDEDVEYDWGEWRSDYLDLEAWIEVSDVNYDVIITWEDDDDGSWDDFFDGKTKALATYSGSETTLIIFCEDLEDSLERDLEWYCNDSGNNSSRECELIEVDCEMDTEGDNDVKFKIHYYTSFGVQTSSIFAFLFCLIFLMF